MTRSQSAFVTSVKAPSTSMPALATRMSMPPNASTAAANMRVTATSSATSA